MDLAKLLDYIAVDSEGDLLGFSLAVPGNSLFIPVAHVDEEVNIDPTSVLKVINDIPYRIYHNAIHDLQIFENYGFPLDGPFIDTMIIAHMVDENVPNKKLDYLHKYYCNPEGGKNMHPLMRSIIDTHGWEWVPIELLCDYATNDAEITLELFLTLKPMYEEQFGSFW